MKISRAGIVLIKSFEGFRPRAIRREDGGWVIGYGHTFSAREGASVSEAEAELLLRYDLLPVEQTVNHAGSAVLNQHQFDAIVSFAFSVGIDRFRTSDVVTHLVSGANQRAADALMGWQETASPDISVRRRSAERALFVADPHAPVALAELLIAPIETDAAPAPPPAPLSEPDPIAPDAQPVPTASAEAPPPLSDAGPTPSEEPQQSNALTAPEARSAAVSVLLGETETPVPADDDAVPSVFNTAAAAPHTAEITPAAANDVEATAALEDQTPPAPLADQDDPAEPSASVRDAEPSPPAVVAAQPSSDAPRPVPDASPRAVDPATLIVQRYAPYSAAMVGPLPFLQPARNRTVEPETSPSTLPEPDQPDAGIQSDASESIAETPERDQTSPAVEIEAVVTPDFTSPEAPVVMPFAPMAEVEPLILSAPETPSPFAVTRQPWTIEERSEPEEPVDGGLFGEDLVLTRGGGPILPSGDDRLAAPASFDWNETGAFIIMGAVGLTSFGAAMAAFRLASETSTGDETTIIAWVLAVIGAACVGVSSFNLYRRWGLPGGDN